MADVNHGIEPVAAEEYDGDGSCDYECDSTADYRVELRGGSGSTTIIRCCQQCSRANRVHARDVLGEEIGPRVDGGTELAVAYECWCEHDGCDWERSGVCKRESMAYRETEGLMFGHGVKSGHHETKRSVGTEADR